MLPAKGLLNAVYLRGRKEAQVTSWWKTYGIRRGRGFWVRVG